MSMFMKEKFVYILASAVAVVISACGSGKSGQVGISGAASTAGVNVSTGPITGFGSVFVNGVEYDTSNTQILMNGIAGTQDDLRIGMMVDVTGSVSPDGTTGTASHIDFNSDVRGVVDSVDPANKALVVMGQSVSVDDLTVFDGTTLGSLQPGNVVEVSGMADSAGVIHATRIEMKSTALTSNSLLEIKGTVSNLDTTNMTFDLGAQGVDYSSAVLKQLPAGLSDGQKVEVKSTQGVNASGTLIAAIVEGQQESSSEINVGEKEVEGLVTDYTSASEFSVGGQAVSTTDQTRYKYGTAADIALNARLEAEGLVNDAGVLVANQVVFKPANKIDISADVQAVDAAAGTLTVLGIQFMVDANTQYHDEGVARVRDFRIKDIAVGDCLEIRAYKSGDSLIAARIERKNPSLAAGVVVRAALESVSAPRLQLLGITVVTDGATSFALYDTSTTADAFFAAAQVGDTVKVQGTLTGDGTIQAARVVRDS